MDWAVSLIAGSYDTGHAEIVFRFFLAIVLGAVIGLERELRDHPAGLRTHILVSLAASLFTIITFELFHDLRSGSGDSQADPIRVIEAVTAGVSFLAAGTIIQARGKVSGLTTGAAMWLAGAVGVACGLGYYFLAIVTTLMSVVIVVAIRKIEGSYLGTKRPRGLLETDQDND